MWWRALLGACIPAKAHLAVISPSAAQGYAEPIIAFPQRLEMNQLDKDIIKLAAEFFWSQLFSLFREVHKKVNELLLKVYFSLALKPKQQLYALLRAGKEAQQCTPSCGSTLALQRLHGTTSLTKHTSLAALVEWQAFKYTRCRRKHVGMEGGKASHHIGSHSHQRTRESITCEKRYILKTTPCDHPPIFR